MWADRRRARRDRRARDGPRRRDWRPRRHRGRHDDGDGDPGTGDGDGDPTTGDGDGDPATGDGDGDPGTGDGDGDATGDGDGDTTTNGDSGEPCSNYFEEEDVLVLGDNFVTVTDAISVVNGSCGSDGPDAIYAFTAEVAGDYTFSLSSEDFDGALYLVGELCNPVDELACEIQGDDLVYAFGADETVFVVVDATVPGDGSVVITGP